MTNLAIVVKEVDEIPQPMKAGILYVCHDGETASHICPCGCGDEIPIPIGKGGWKFTHGPTLSPSLSNRRCKAHYWIRNGWFVFC